MALVAGGSPGTFLWPLPLPLTLDGSTGSGWAHRHIQTTKLLDPAPSLLVWITTKGSGSRGARDGKPEEPLKRDHVPGVSDPSQGLSDEVDE